jgi:hypothetical protein
MAEGKGRVIFSCFLAWLVPGGGHLFLKKWGRGILFFVLVLGMFVLGISLKGKLYSLNEGPFLSFLAALGDISVGAPYFIARGFELTASDITSFAFNYGTTFLIVAGLLNILLILDAYDIAVGRKE